MNTIKSRLLKLADYKELSIRAFEEFCGLNRGNISNLATNGNIGSDKLSKIIDALPEINTYWLLTGEGDMLKSQALESQVSPMQNNLQKSVHHISHTASISGIKIIGDRGPNVEENGSIPLVYEKAVGGFYNKDFKISERDIMGYYIIPKFRHLGVDFMIEVVGDSMLPRFFPGDIIACSIISNPQFIQWNKCHLIATREQGLIIKRLMPGDNDACFKAVSDNKDYPPFSIPKDEICGLARIVGSIHVE